MPAYTCPHCHSSNNIGVVGAGKGVQVQCPACERWFEPARYVTEEDRAPKREVLHRAQGLPDADVACARDRLEQHVRKYGDYLDRDRDILLLRIFEDITGIERR